METGHELGELNTRKSQPLGCQGFPIILNEWNRRWPEKYLAVADSGRLALRQRQSISFHLFLT